MILKAMMVHDGMKWAASSAPLTVRIRQLFGMSLPASSASSTTSGGFAGEVTRLNSEGQFKPFVYLNAGRRRPDVRTSSTLCHGRTCQPSLKLSADRHRTARRSLGVAGIRPSIDLRQEAFGRWAPEASPRVMIGGIPEKKRPALRRDLPCSHLGPWSELTAALALLVRFLALTIRVLLLLSGLLAAALLLTGLLIRILLARILVGVGHRDLPR